MRTYSREELEKIFNTDRTDTIKKRLERAGYGFENGGRGKDYWIKITALPEPPSAYEEFMRREFGYGPQTKLAEAEVLFGLLLTDNDFCYHPATYQSQLLKEQFGVELSAQTIRNWRKKLKGKNWFIDNESDCRYVLCRKGVKPEEIDAEVYKAAWREFFEAVRNGADPGQMRQRIYWRYGGMPRKQAKFTENALEQVKINELRSILSGNGQF